MYTAHTEFDPGNGRDFRSKPFVSNGEGGIENRSIVRIETIAEALDLLSQRVSNELAKIAGLERPQEGRKP